jgi:hypothetical protein
LEKKQELFAESQNEIAAEAEGKRLERVLAPIINFSAIRLIC